jgi:hypothetical protein
MAWPTPTLVHGAHTVTYRATAFDPGWAGAGGPGAALTLQVIAAGVDFDTDRVPQGRATLVVAPPVDAGGVSLIRWLSPLPRTCVVDLHVSYDGAETRALTMLLRRRRLSWPSPGDVTLDLATRDVDAWAAWSTAVVVGGG